MTTLNPLISEYSQVTIMSEVVQGEAVADGEWGVC